MKSSRQFLLGLLALGLQAGIAAAQAPAASLPAPSPTAAPQPAAVPPQLLAPTACSCESCCDGSGRSGLIGGFGLYIIQPYFNNNMAFALQQTRPGLPGSPSSTRVDISHHVQAAPLLWLGYIGDNGLGGRVRYWYFSQGSDQSVAAPTGQGANALSIISSAPLGLGFVNGQAMDVTSKLQFQVVDLEALNDIRAGGWDLLFAGGLRTTRINQSYNAFIPQSRGGALLSSNTFEGVGPTLALEARRALGRTGLSLYASARGSVVFGSAHQFATFPDNNTAAQDHRDLGLPIAEMELGMEYGRSVGRSWLFGQVALVGQQWFGAGSASRSSVNVVPGGAFLGNAYVGDSDIDFLGLSIRLGVNY